MRAEILRRDGRHEKRSLRTASLRLRFKFNPLAVASSLFETSVLVFDFAVAAVFHFVTFARTRRCAR